MRAGTSFSDFEFARQVAEELNDSFAGCPARRSQEMTGVALQPISTRPRQLITTSGDLQRGERVVGHTRGQALKECAVLAEDTLLLYCVTASCSTNYSNSSEAKKAGGMQRQRKRTSFRKFPVRGESSKSKHGGGRSEWLSREAASEILCRWSSKRATYSDKRNLAGRGHKRVVEIPLHCWHEKVQ